MAKSKVVSKKGENKHRNVYMDYASATMLDPRVLDIMTQVSRKFFSNASAVHDNGVKTREKIEEARTKIAKIIEGQKDEIIFTSGSTESNNLAILGIVKKFEKIKPHIVTTNIEHASVLEVCKYLEEKKIAKVTYVGVEDNGIVDPRKIKKALTKDTVLVSVMYVNNEIGTIQPIREIVKEIRHFQKNQKNNTQRIFFHTDATQAVNYLPLNVLKLGVDLMSFNSAKIYGPKGMGVLFKKRNVSLDRILYGGDQEMGLRPGTENIVSIVGLSRALEITEELKDSEVNRLTKLRDYFFKKISGLDFIINGDLENRLPNNINITIPKIPSDLLVIEFSARGIMASAKSACKSGDGKASHVIEAIRPKAKETDGSLRFSLGRDTIKEDIDYTVKSLKEIINKLKRWYN
jgi:cysteine desulfurase